MQKMNKGSEKSKGYASSPFKIIQMVISLFGLSLKIPMEFDDLRAYGAAIQNIQIFGGTGFAYIPFNCAQALIAIISDFILSLDVVDIAIIYAMQTDGIRFSVRCEQNRIHAGNLISQVLRPFGSGGGHPSMAGGMIPATSVHLLGEDIHTSIQEAFLHPIEKMEKELSE